MSNIFIKLKEFTHLIIKGKFIIKGHHHNLHLVYVKVYSLNPFDAVSLLVVNFCLKPAEI